MLLNQQTKEIPNTNIFKEFIAKNNLCYAFMDENILAFYNYRVFFVMYIEMGNLQFHILDIKHHKWCGNFSHQYQFEEGSNFYSEYKEILWKKIDFVEIVDLETTRELYLSIYLLDQHQSPLLKGDFTLLNNSMIQMSDYHIKSTKEFLAEQEAKGNIKYTNFHKK